MFLNVMDSILFPLVQFRSARALSHQLHLANVTVNRWAVGGSLPASGRKPTPRTNRTEPWACLAQPFRAAPAQRALGGGPGPLKMLYLCSKLLTEQRDSHCWS